MNSDIPITLGVWLADEGGYDLKPEPNTISATSLLKPIRSLILSSRMPEELKNPLQNLSSKIGTAIHDSVETAWKGDLVKNLVKLGYPQHVAERFKVNPENPQMEDINVYLERRVNKQFNGFTISGKFDNCIDGELGDIKSTKVYGYVAGTKDLEYRMQGSIYRWLNQDIVTSEFLNIEFVFTDWSGIRAKADKDYPSSDCLRKKYQLFSIEETEHFIREQTNKIKALQAEMQENLPLCTMKELWQELPTYAYYKDPSKMSRATKLFNLVSDAEHHRALQQGKGIIIKRDAEVKRCHYCDAMPICTQAETLRESGLLK